MSDEKRFVSMRLHLPVFRAFKMLCHREDKSMQYMCEKLITEYIEKEIDVKQFMNKSD